MCTSVNMFAPFLWCINISKCKRNLLNNQVNSSVYFTTLFKAARMFGGDVVHSLEYMVTCTFWLPLQRKCCFFFVPFEDGNSTHSWNNTGRVV
jgi:hypothetical protein